MSHAIHSPSAQHNSWRGRAIRRILDARFSMSAFEESMNADPVWWSSTGNDMGRGIYGEAQREARRLLGVTDAELEAELAASYWNFIQQ